MDFSDGKIETVLDTMFTGKSLYNKMDFSDGKLEIVLGTMFSGKTKYILSQILVFANKRFKILYINIEFDNRSESAFSTHNPFINSKEYENKENIKKNVTMIKRKNLESIDFKPYDIVIIDEAHFFQDLVNFTHQLLKNKKYVIIASLIADFKGNKFGNIYDLIPICDDIKRLQAYCEICAQEESYRVAIYSKRMGDSKETIEIGGSEKYIPVCREHYFNELELNKLTSIDNSIKKHLIIDDDSIDFDNFSQFL